MNAEAEALYDRYFPKTSPDGSSVCREKIENPIRYFNPISKSCQDLTREQLDAFQLATLRGQIPGGESFSVQVRKKDYTTVGLLVASLAVFWMFGK